MTNQEAFEKMVRHLRTQREVAVMPGTHIRVLVSPDGKKCAIGALIPPEEYFVGLEGNDVDVVQEFCPSLEGVSLSLMADMQRLHDQTPVDLWEREYSKIAQKFGLKLSS